MHLSTLFFIAINDFRVIEDCELHEVLSKNGSVSGVVTSKGYIKCKYFVNTAGMWARHVGYLSNPRVQVRYMIKHV